MHVVFIILARKADSLGDKTILAGWLCRTARYASAKALTIQRRRQQREQEAYMKSTLQAAESCPSSDGTAPVARTTLATVYAFEAHTPSSTTPATAASASSTVRTNSRHSCKNCRHAGHGMGATLPCNMISVTRSGEFLINLLNRGPRTYNRRATVTAPARLQILNSVQSRWTSRVNPRYARRDRHHGFRPLPWSLQFVSLRPHHLRRPAHRRPRSHPEHLAEHRDRPLPDHLHLAELARRFPPNQQD